MRIVLGCTRYTLIGMMRQKLGLTSVKSRHVLAQVKAYFCITTVDRQPLFVNVNVAKVRRIKRQKSWMAQAEDAIGREWIGSKSEGITFIK